MIIDPILGIKRKEIIIPENSFSSFSIFPTGEKLRTYFENYGYEFIGEYDLGENLIIIKNNNTELSTLTRNYDFYFIMNYKTKEMVRDCTSKEVEYAKQSTFSHEKILSFYDVIETEKGMTLVDKRYSNLILTAEQIEMLNPKLALVQNYGLDIIFDLEELKCYPLIKQEKEIYVGSHEKDFLHMRFGMYSLSHNMIHSFFIENTDLWKLVEEFPFGEVKGSHFYLLNCLYCYGIFYNDKNITQIQWYDSKQERDTVLKQLGLAVEKILEEEKGKIKHMGFPPNR